jgi:hypothetical protein
MGEEDDVGRGKRKEGEKKIGGKGWGIRRGSRPVTENILRNYECQKKQKSKHIHHGRNKGLWDSIQNVSSSNPKFLGSEGHKSIVPQYRFFFWWDNGFNPLIGLWEYHSKTHSPREQTEATFSSAKSLF